MISFSSPYSFIFTEDAMTCTYYTRLIPLSQDNLGTLDFNEARDDWAAVASARSYASHLHFAEDR